MKEKEKAPISEGKGKNDVTQDKNNFLKNNELGENISTKIKSRLISLSSPLPENVYLLEKNGVGVISRGDIIAITGKHKQGKTQVEKIFSAALLKGNFLGFTAIKQNIKVLYIDTEQNPINTQKFAKDVHKLVGWRDDENNPLFFCLNLRADSAEDRINITQEAVSALSPDVVMIDGIKDLLSDINDTTQSAKVLNLLMKLTKDFPIALFAILHENKNDANLRGHIGTELANKCSEIWKVKKDGNLFEVTQEVSRNAPADGFTFRILEGMITEGEILQKIDKTAEAERKMRLNFQHSLLKKNLNYSELREVYMEVSGLAKKTAETHISTAIRRGYIKRKEDGIYSLENTFF